MSDPARATLFRSAKPTYRPPNDQVRDVLRAARDQHVALRDALSTTIDFDCKDITDPTARVLANYVNDIGTAICAALNGYHRLRDHVRTVAELEGWERSR